MTQPLFVFMLSLLLVHEMDAIRTKEWRMFILLKDMAEETAYRVFTLAHLPLYFLVLLILVQGTARSGTFLCYVADFFLVGHTILHYAFKRHPNNGFRSAFSKSIICLLGIAAVLHLCLL